MKLSKSPNYNIKNNKLVRKRMTKEVKDCTLNTKKHF